jgi:hypothetical protein
MVKTGFLAKNGINQGWLEFLPDTGDPVPVGNPSKSEYLDLFRDAEERLITQGISVTPIPLIQPIRGMEVGDDRKDESLSPTGLAVALAAQSQIFKMKTSENDTFISSKRSNFCEVTTITPRSVLGSYHNFRKTGTTENLEFVDVMPLRLVEPVAKGKGTDHSSSKSGKASLAGPKQSFAREDLKEEMMLHNFFQDGCLVTVRSREPKYLPTILGGSGAPSLWAEYRNQYLYMIAFRGSGYSRVYGTAIQEVNETLRRLEFGQGYNVPHLALKLRDKQEYLYGTYAEKVFVPTAEMKSQYSERLPPPLYKGGGTTNDLASYEARLMGAKVLVTRAQAEIEYERSQRNGSVLFGLGTVHSSKFKQKQDSMSARKAFDGALSANSAFSNLLSRQANQKDVQQMMKDPSFNVVSQGAREYTLRHAKWVHEGCKSDTYSLRDILRSQDMFLRSEVSTDEEMKVSGIEREWVRNGKSTITETRAEVGLWKVSQDAQEWAAVIAAKLSEKRVEKSISTLDRSDVLNVYWGHRELVADDPLIVQRVIQISQQLTSTENGVIFTKDRSLVKACANRAGMNFFRISPSVLLSLIKGLDPQNECMEFDMNPMLVGSKLKLPGNPVRIAIVDTGSLDETLAKYELDIKPEKSKILRRTRLSYGKSSSGRYEVFSVREIGKSSLAGIFDPKAKDESGRPAFEMIKPEKSIRLKIPKFESFSGSSHRSGSILSGVSEGELIDWHRPALPSETV